jgi:hypothetical protein
MPPRHDTRFAAIARQARAIFDRHAGDGLLQVNGHTELHFGRLTR